MKNNRRLKEIKLSIYINYISKLKSRVDYESMIKILASLALTYGDEIAEEFSKFVLSSVNDGLLEATSKELVACCSTYFSISKAARLLNTTTYKYTTKYADLLSRDFVTEDYLASLTPMFNSDKGKLMVEFMLSFIENFIVPVAMKPVYDLNRRRVLELDFYLIYSKMFDIFRNDIFIGKFIFNLCKMFEIDYPSVVNLKHQIHIITRELPNFRYNSVYFKQELYTLFSKRGYSKCSIGIEVFNKNGNYLFGTGSKLFTKDLPSKDLAWSFYETANWANASEDAVQTFISILHQFVRQNGRFTK